MHPSYASQTSRKASTVIAGSRTGYFRNCSKRLASCFAVAGAAILAMGASAEEAKDDKNIIFAANGEWRPVDMSDVQVKAGSALDLSSLCESGPAGQHGPVIVSKSGHFAFTDSPDVPVRFSGYNGFFLTFKQLDDPDKAVVQERFVKLAALIKRQGFNLVRPMPIESYIMKGSTADCVFSPDKLDNIDRLIAELKAQGVYLYMDIAAYRFGRADAAKSWGERNDDKLKLLLGEPEARARWQAMAEKMLAHVNPYTKVAWKDEPAIITVNVYNEQDIQRWRPLSTFKPETIALLNDRWRAWLKNKYQTFEALSKAWDNRGIYSADSFEKLSVPQNRNGSTPNLNDYTLFNKQLAEEEMAWASGILRKIGYKGPISLFDVSAELADGALRWETSDIVCHHTYFSHPSKLGQVPCEITQQSSLGDQAGYWRQTNSARLCDRPFLETEYHHIFWNRYQHEGGLVFASYSALQGFDALCVHEDPVALEVTAEKTKGAMDWIAANPVARANQFMSAMLFQRGDVKEAGHQVRMTIPSAYLNANNNGSRAISTEQNKIGLITGFSLAFPDLKRPESLKSIPPKPDMSILPDTGAEVEGADWTASVKSSGSGDFSLAKFVADLKARKILPESNWTNPQAGIFQSDTGEITMRSNENLLKVVTPKTEGVTLEANKAETLAALHVEGSSIPAAISVSAIDGQPLDSSSRMVFIYNTEMAFSGMEVSPDHTQKFKEGTLPVLLRAGKLEARLKCRQADKMAMYALAIDGTHTEKIPVTAKDGVLKISLDTAALTKTATPFFELVAE